MRDIHCATLNCRNNLRGVVIGRTNGTEAEMWCGECRKITHWRYTPTPSPMIRVAVLSRSPILPVIR